MVNDFSDLINYSNSYSLWEVYSQHWQADIHRRDIINQIMEAAFKYRNTCAECRWGEPCGYNYRNLLNAKTARTCLCGYTKYHEGVRDTCPKFQAHNRFRLWIEAKGMSRRELAELVGKSRITVTQYCLGNRKPKPETARIYAEALGIQVADLIGE